MHEKHRHKISVDEFALARGAERPVATKQEAEKVWWPLLVGDVMSGRNPRVPPQRPENGAKTIEDYIDGYIKDYVELTPLRSRRSKRNASLNLKRVIGHYAVKMLGDAGASRGCPQALPEPRGVDVEPIPGGVAVHHELGNCSR